MSKKTVSVFLVCLMILSLAACGKQSKNEPAELVVEGNTVPGYIPSEIAVPAELGMLQSSWDAQGDTLYLSGQGGSAVIGC